VEYYLLRRDDGDWIGLGSDHTDREVEAYNVTVSKQCCPKPIASTLWRHADLRDHWDQLMLRSYRLEGGEKILYQEGAVTAMIEPLALAAQYADEYTALTPGQIMFGGTLPVIGGLTGAEAFAIELEDPVLGRKISHDYRVATLPNIG
jgi:hypothetical protein